MILKIVSILCILIICTAFDIYKIYKISNYGEQTIIFTKDEKFFVFEFTKGNGE